MTMLRSAATIAVAACASTLLLASPATADDLESYGYYRIVEAGASATQDGEQVELQENQPLLSGDRLWTPPGRRVEVVLPDRSLVRVEGGSSVVFADLAYSADRYAESTRLLLEQGEIEVTLPRETLGEVLARVDTPDATVYLETLGSFAVAAGARGTRAVVRQGSAEVLTSRDSARLRSGEAAEADGDRLAVGRATGPSSLERWAAELDREASSARYAWDDDLYDGGALGYSASSLDRYGRWETIDSRRVWRPSVDAGWEPYRHGRWTSTPSGLTWVSYEPWGWVPYHYGNWDYLPRHGWVWYPGRVYAPAWVYWYWGPQYVGWCPTGYYTRYYGPRYYGGWHGGWGFRHGIHGWAGGRWDHFDRWQFVPVGDVQRPQLAYRTRTSAQLRHAVGGELGRGLITTDTRPLRGSVVTRPGVAVDALRDAARGRELADVTRFVARDPDLPREIGRAVVPLDDSPRRDGDRTVTTRPGVARRPADAVRPGSAGAVRRPAPAGGSERAPTAGAPSRETPRGTVTTRPAVRPDADGMSPRGATARPAAPARRPAAETTERQPDARLGLRPAAPPSERGRAPAYVPDRAGGSRGTVTTRPQSRTPSARPEAAARPAPGDRERSTLAPRSGVPSREAPERGSSSQWSRPERPPVRRVVEGVRSPRPSSPPAAARPAPHSFERRPATTAPAPRPTRPSSAVRPSDTRRESGMARPSAPSRRPTAAPRPSAGSRPSVAAQPQRAERPRSAERSSSRASSSRATSSRETRRRPD